MVNRGYKTKFVRDQIQRARALDCEELLEGRPQSPKRGIPFVVTYYPGLPNIGRVLRELHFLMHISEKIKRAIRDLPMMAFRQPKSLKDYLFHAKLRPLDRNNGDSRGTQKCSSAITLLRRICFFFNKVTGTSYSINHRLDVNSRNVVYLVSCKVCGLQYVGSTTTKFRLRFNNHKSRLQEHFKMSDANKVGDDLIYRYFYSQGHHGLQDVTIQLIDKVNAKDDLIVKEGQWAYRLRSLRPDGLNESDFFFSQNRGERTRK